MSGYVGSYLVKKEKVFQVQEIWKLENNIEKVNFSDYFPLNPIEKVNIFPCPVP
jgi:hypothetical protein